MTTVGFNMTKGDKIMQDGFNEILYQLKYNYKEREGLYMAICELIDRFGADPEYIQDEELYEFVKGERYEDAKARAMGY